MNGFDDGGARGRNEQSPVLQNRLPPGYDNKRSKKMPKKKVGRRISRNLLPTSGLPPKPSNLRTDACAHLPAESQKRIDYVIVYENKSEDEVGGERERRKMRRNLEFRANFLKALEYDGIEVKEDVIGNNVFMQLHVPFYRLCEQAEKIKLELPLKGVRKYLLSFLGSVSIIDYFTVIY